jgi:2-phospho-L-lactate/phosphoenolpyruvate guanylyltransferase
VSQRIIVPHRGLAAAKTRLSGVLDPDQRGELAGRLLEHVLRTVAEAGPGQGEVITPDPDLRPVVEAAGLRLVVQRGMGLNAGLEQARAAALGDGTRTLVVIHGDLPDLTPADISALIGAVPAAGGVAIAPDRRGTGTNGLAMCPADAIAFRFGVGSFAAHRSAAEDAGYEPVVVERPGLAFDLDTPEDLAGWLARGDAA